ncbi:MAG: hypothetical protein KF739_04690 [Cryobacterium sp.]|nr:hypothetical protein [Cryobacterium sp.]
MNAPVDLNLIVNWPQAMVASVIVLAVVIGLPVVNIIQNRAIKQQNERALTTLTTNNGGSTVKDRLDKIVSKLDEVQSTQQEHGERLSELEAVKGKHRTEEPAH